MKKTLFIFLTLFLVTVSAFGQSTDESVDANARLKALYLYNFARNVDWPTEYKTGPFVIAVIGNDAVYNKLVELYSSKSIGSQPIEIKKVTNVANIGKVHLVYVAANKQEKLSQVLKTQGKRSALIVTENDGDIVDGTVINFIIINNRLKYELSKKGASQRKLTLGQTLEKLAYAVKD